MFEKKQESQVKGSCNSSHEPMRVLNMEEHSGYKAKTSYIIKIFLLQIYTKYQESLLFISQDPRSQNGGHTGQKRTPQTLKLVYN